MECITVTYLHTRPSTISTKKKGPNSRHPPRVGAHLISLTTKKGIDRQNWIFGFCRWVSGSYLKVQNPWYNFQSIPRNAFQIVKIMKKYKWQLSNLLCKENISVGDGKTVCKVIAGYSFSIIVVIHFLPKGDNLIAVYKYLHLFLQFYSLLKLISFTIEKFFYNKKKFNFMQTNHPLTLYTINWQQYQSHQCS